MPVHPPSRRRKPTPDGADCTAHGDRVGEDVRTGADDSCAAVRTSPATARERLCAGQARTVVTCGASVRGMAACALHSHDRAEAQRTADGVPEGDQLGQLRLVVDLGARAGLVGAVLAGPAGDRQVWHVADVGHGQRRTRGEGMPGGQDGDLLLGQQVLGVEPGEGVEGPLHERHVGAAVAQHPRLVSHAAQQHLDLGRVRLGGVGVEKLPQQFVIRAGLRRQRQAVRGGRGAAGAAGGRGGSVEDGAGLVEQHLTRTGQGDAAAVAFEQGDAEAPFELLNRPGQRRLSHAEALGRPAEVQLLGDGDEVPELAGLQRVHRTDVLR